MKEKLAQRGSFLSLESDHAVISAVKEAEDKDGVIVRAYETKKQDGRAVLKVPFLNREEELTFTPCEIKTVKLPYDHSCPIQEVNLLEFRGVIKSTVTVQNRGGISGWNILQELI